MGEQDNEQGDQTTERLREVGELPAPGEVQAPTVEALEAECDRLTRQNAELTDQLLRWRADLENLRKRVERERQEVQARAAMDAAASVLPALDGLERALAGDQNAASEFHAGVELIARQLRETLIKSGLEPIEALGQKFDPHLHEAVERVETTEHEDQTVVEQWQRGYRFRGRLLRPAMVKVAVRPESR